MLDFLKTDFSITNRIISCADKQNSSTVLFATPISGAMDSLVHLGVFFIKFIPVTLLCNQWIKMDKSMQDELSYSGLATHAEKVATFALAAFFLPIFAILHVSDALSFAFSLNLAPKVDKRRQERPEKLRQLKESQKEQQKLDQALKGLKKLIESPGENLKLKERLQALQESKNAQLDLEKLRHSPGEMERLGKFLDQTPEEMQGLQERLKVDQLGKFIEVLPEVDWQKHMIGPGRTFMQIPENSSKEDLVNIRSSMIKELKEIDMLLSHNKDYDFRSFYDDLKKLHEYKKVVQEAGNKIAAL